VAALTAADRGAYTAPPSRRAETTQLDEGAAT
jgi:hypothetical protein